MLGVVMFETYKESGFSGKTLARVPVIPPNVHTPQTMVGALRVLDRGFLDTAVCRV